MYEEEHSCDVLKKTNAILIYNDDGWWVLDLIFERASPIAISFCPFCGKELE